MEPTAGYTSTTFYLQIRMTVCIYPVHISRNAGIQMADLSALAHLITGGRQMVNVSTV